MSCLGGSIRSRQNPNLHGLTIKIDESQRVFVLPTSDSLGARAALIVAALITASGLTWLVISALPSPFASTSVGRSGGGLNSSAQIPASNKGDRLPISNTFVRDAVSATSRETPVAVAPLESKPSSIFRWGNRLMVATSGGLISAP